MDEDNHGKAVFCFSVHLLGFFLSLCARMDGRHGWMCVCVSQEGVCGELTTRMFFCKPAQKNNKSWHYWSISQWERVSCSDRTVSKCWSHGNKKPKTQHFFIMHAPSPSVWCLAVRLWSCSHYLVAPFKASKLVENDKMDWQPSIWGGETLQELHPLIKNIQNRSLLWYLIQIKRVKVTSKAADCAKYMCAMIWYIINEANIHLNAIFSTENNAY